MFRNKKKLVVALIAVVALIIVSVAAAAWLSTSNSTTGKGRLSNVVNLIATPVSTAPSDSDAYPGGALDIVFNVAGPASYTVNKAAFTTPLTVSVPSMPACDAFLSIGGPWNTYATYSAIPPVPLTGAGNPTLVTVPNAIMIDPAIPQTCANQEVIVSGTGGVSASAATP